MKFHETGGDPARVEINRAKVAEFPSVDEPDPALKSSMAAEEPG